MPNISRGLDGCMGIDAPVADSVLALELDLAFAATSSGSFQAVAAAVFGYLPNEATVEGLLGALGSRDPRVIRSQSLAKWAAQAVALDAPALSTAEAAPSALAGAGSGDEYGATSAWVQRETVWHSYMLRSGVTLDGYFQERILNQNGNYLYDGGEQAAARDPLGHVLPLILQHGGSFNGSFIADSVIRYTLKSRQQDGHIPWGICAFGNLCDRPASDLDLMLLLTASQRALATRDLAFLQVTYTDVSGRTLSVLQGLQASFEYMRTSIGVGRHGLLRVEGGDWSDGILTYCAATNATFTIEYGESALNAAIAAYVLPRWAEVLELAGQNGSDVRAFGEAQAQALEAQWTGQWFPRGWYGPTENDWCGKSDGQLWAHVQSFALMAGLLNNTQAQTLAQRLEEDVCSPSLIGATNTGPKPLTDHGTSDAGGVWPATNLWLIYGLGLRGFGALAWSQWTKNSMNHHETVFPDIWYGVTSGPDVFDSHFSQHEGSTRCQWIDPSDAALRFPFECEESAVPTLNGWAHTQPLWSALGVLGVDFRGVGLALRPNALPVYNFTSPLLSLARQAAEPGSPCKFQGRWSASSIASIRGLVVQLRFGQDATCSGCSQAKVDNGSWEATNCSSSMIALAFADVPAAWELR